MSMKWMLSIEKLKILKSKLFLLSLSITFLCLLDIILITFHSIQATNAKAILLLVLFFNVNQSIFLSSVAYLVQLDQLFL